MSRKHLQKPVKGGEFKNAFEEKVWGFLPKKRSKYEVTKLKYNTDHVYTPDFTIDMPDGTQLLLEAKGYLRPEDRTKMKAVKEHNPDLDIRFVFAVNNKLNKNSKKTYTDWATENGFPSAVGKVPSSWIYPTKHDKEYASKWYRENRERHLKTCRARVLKKLYGITEADVDRMSAEQDHKCGICSVEFSTLPRRPDVDHCHETGKVRGLLCWNCNGGLGNFSDNPDTLFKAIEYLKRSG